MVSASLLLLQTFGRVCYRVLGSVNLTNSSVVYISDQVVILDFDLNATTFRCACVHGSHFDLRRKLLWMSLNSDFSYNMLLVGDFNAVLGAHERRSSVLPEPNSCRDFREFIDAGWKFLSRVIGTLGGVVFIWRTM